MKNKKIFLIIFCGLLVFLLIFVFTSKNGSDERQSSVEPPETEKIRIAACPTYHEIDRELDAEKYQVIYTESTAESVKLLLGGRADIILAGRTLRPGEPNMDAIVIDKGYSFLGRRGMVVYAGALKNHRIYTDLNIESIKANFPVGEIQKVDDVYDYLDEGIVITSWENIDYGKAELVHVLEDNGERVKISRQPTVYCPLSCDTEITATIISALKN